MHIDSLCGSARAVSSVCRLTFGVALATAACGGVWADDLGAVTMFGQDYRLTRFDYQSLVRFSDAKNVGKIVGLNGVSGVTVLPNGNMLIATNTMNLSPISSFKNYILEVKLTMTSDGLPSGLSYVRTVLTNDNARDGYDLDPRGVAVNTDTTGIACNGNFVVTSGNNLLRPFYLANGSPIVNSSFPSGYPLSPPNSTTQDVVYVPERRAFFTLWPSPTSAVTIFGRDGSIGPAFYAAANATPGVLGVPVGMAHLDPSGAYPKFFNYNGGILVSLDEHGPAIEAYSVDGNLLTRQALSATLDMNVVTLPLINTSAPLRLEGIAGDPATGRLFLFNHGTVTGGTAVFVLSPIPKPCPADVTLDGFVDYFDFFEFIDAFETDQPLADTNHDGFIDYFDFLEFTNSFEAGC